MITAIVIEDELEGLEHILRLVKNNLPDVDVIGTGRSNADLLRLIEEEDLQPDVMLLDIKLPDGQVFQSLDVIDTSDIHLIFTTAYDEYALQAFDKAAIHYLLKPISKDDLLLAFQRVKRNITQTKDETSSQLTIAKTLIEMGHNALDRVGIGSVNGVRFVSFRDIVRMAGEDNYTTFFMADGEQIIASRNLGYFKDRFEKYNFVKIHQSHMVNINHLLSYHRGDGGMVQLSNGDQVPLARRLRSNFLDRIRAFSDLG